MAAEEFGADFLIQILLSKKKKPFEKSFKKAKIVEHNDAQKLVNVMNDYE